jgi:hypothetical protein
MGHNARYARLAIEYTKLMNLAARSSFINIRPIEVQPGWPPEKYIITYTCRGIASIDKKVKPRLSDFHQVSMYMGSEYPLKEPYLKWMTPIWHPNIEHQEPHHVCTNNVQNWFAAKPLAELVLAMGEMVQYKHYHAKWIAPFPLDREAADWVLEFAEPQGILGPGKPLDDRPLLQPQRMRNKSEKPLMSTGEMKKRMTLGRAPVMVRSMSGQIIVGVGDDQTIDAPTAVPGVKPAVAIKFGQRKKEGVPVNTPVPENSTRPLVLPVPSTGNGAPTSGLYSIEIHKDGKLQRVEQIVKPILSIGRGAADGSVDLVLPGDPTISRLHAIIERDESGALWLTVKGQNPVVVAGRVVPRERSIGVQAGQEIEICSYIITLRQQP